VTESTTPRYRYWGDRKPVALARPVETVQMAADTGRMAQIRLYGPIDSWGAPFGVAASEVAAALDSIGSSDVEMHVHSPGGDAFEGLAIMNLLRQHPGAVDIVVDGLAASAASIVAMGADTVTMVPGSQMMIHDASALAIGQASDMRQAADMLDSISSNAADQYAAKTGQTSDTMRAAMKATTWYKAQEAVDAGLADGVLTEGDPQTQTAKAATASLVFDLSMFDREPAAPRASATQTPAIPPVAPSTEPKEADTMSDTLLAGLRKQLGLADDADEATVLAANAEALNEAAEPPAAATVDTKAIAAALAADGKVVVSQIVLDELKAGAQAGVEARSKQLADDRDETIKAAFAAGKISAERVEAWTASWDKDPEGTKADLESLPVRFPVASNSTGYQGHDGSVGDAAFTDAQADAVAAQFGVSKEALLNG
jgi:ATP-dependent protease ClpP protease subunit